MTKSESHFAKNFMYQITQERASRYFAHKQHVILVPARGEKKRLNKRINSLKFFRFTKSDPCLIRLY